MIRCVVEPEGLIVFDRGRLAILLFESIMADLNQLEHESDVAEWKAIVAEYQQPSLPRAIWQMVNTLVPFGCFGISCISAWRFRGGWWFRWRFLAGGFWCGSLLFSTTAARFLFQIAEGE